MGTFGFEAPQEPVVYAISCLKIADDQYYFLPFPSSNMATGRVVWFADATGVVLYFLP